MITKRSGIEKQLQQLDSALSTSFANLKRDFMEQAKTIEKLRVKIAEQEKVTQHLKAEIAKLKRVPPKPKPPKSPVRKASTQSSPVLTPLHLQLLKHLVILQLESGRRNVSMRELATELYPDKAYSSIKTTLSKYVDDLHNEEFIEKVRRYRLYISYTEKALRYADSERISRMKELISETR